ncbi:hypothetical protein [Dysgonomonas sp. HGC4]|uniref:hypothetical protein n=1 Tax=Dysgonomonas sp. HGC4 TaxID=1658009 RepID=UPI0006806B2E|nr:hypothetical protein [Dysgonomonas sp. HGC4]MBD8348561.1 hypothetical protein [Dysgonomonas sp. HGC4]
MKIEKVTNVSFLRVDTDDNVYERYGYDGWYIRIGESTEPVYDCEELEEEFQRFITLNNI